MYEQFYGLTEKPFNVTPDPRFLYLGKHHQEALAHLLYGISEKKGFVVITGEVGTGKTTLLRSLLERLDVTVKTALIFNPSLSLEDFFLLVSDEFELKPEGPSKGQFLLALNGFLLDCASRNEIAVLIVDEAQNLSPELMEEIRMLLNLETASEKLLQIVLSGQPELMQKLNLPELRQLKQRISLRYDVHPLTKSETAEYIRERLRKAGAKNTDLFTTRALDKIFAYSRGIPRLVNVLCDSSLLAGYADEREIIDVEIVRECIVDLEGAASRITRAGAADASKKDAGGRSWRRAGIYILLMIVALLSFWVLQLEYPFFWSEIVARGNSVLTSRKHYSGERKALPDQGGRAVAVNRLAEPEPLTPAMEDADKTEQVVSMPAAEPAVMASEQEGTGSVGAADQQEAASAVAPVSATGDAGTAGEAVQEPEVDGDIPVSASGRIVTVEKNDSLSKISMRWYGLMTADILRKIKDANPQIVDLDYIEEGWKIVLPDVRDNGTSNQMFSVHVASFKKFEDAYGLFTKLVQESREAYLVPVSIPGRGGWYRVTVGGFKTKGEAKAYAEELVASRLTEYAEPLAISETAPMEIEIEGEERIHE